MSLRDEVLPPSIAQVTVVASPSSTSGKTTV